MATENTQCYKKKRKPWILRTHSRTNQPVSYEKKTISTESI